jgi:hypothetical protein
MLRKPGGIGKMLKCYHHLSGENLAQDFGLSD